MKLTVTDHTRSPYGMLLLSVLVAMFAMLGQGHRASAAGVVVNKPAIVQNTGGGGVRFREGASRGYAIKGTLGAGDQVFVLEGPVPDSDGRRWYRVSIAGRIGWIDGRYLGPVSSAATQAQQKPVSNETAGLSKYAKVANTGGDAVRVRNAPGGRIIGTVREGTLLQVAQGPIKDKSRTVWYQVSGANVTGWVASLYLTNAQPPASSAVRPPVKGKVSAAPTVPAQARTGSARGTQAPPAARSTGGGLINVAMQYVGRPYRFGGTTPAGFDCSGFVYYVFNKSGIALGRAMTNQLSSGMRVASSALQPGDIVYFANTYKPGISHNGIYIGNGKMVHAGDYDTGVTVSNIWSPYWASHYAGAVRLSR